MTAISIKTNLPIVRKGLEDLAAEVPLVGRKTIYDMMLRMKRKLKVPGARPTYPIQWDSDRQRKAFFASDGFGRGIPTQRSNALVNSWDIVKLPAGYKIENNTDYAKYVVGNAFGQRYSGIHAGRWQMFRDVVENEITTLPREIENSIKIVSRRHGF